MISNILTILKNPSLILPYDRGDGQRITFTKPFIFPCNRGNTKGSKNTTNRCCFSILTPLPQSDGRVKNRPAVVLRKMPVYGDLLVCGISSQVQHYLPEFDELITRKDDDFKPSGLITDSVIRLGFLAVLPQRNILGAIGAISPERHINLLTRLSRYLIENRL